MSADRTVRQMIAELLTGGRMTTRGISQAVKIREKDVIDHLEHIARSAPKYGNFYIEPSVCRRCGFRFKDRKRLKSPSRCPICKNEAITEQGFWIEKR